MPVKEIDWRRMGILVGVFIIGCIIGVRYLSDVEAFRVTTGLLPPYRCNIAAGGYRDPSSPLHKLTKGMAKAHVVDLLSIGRTEVIAGNRLANGPNNEHAYGLHEVDLPRIAEVWCIPQRSIGISSYVYLVFDKAQCLDRWGVSEFMPGFAADRQY